MEIGKINIPQAVLLAPMESITDQSFRLICKQMGADIVYTEFVNSEGLIRQNEKTRRKMKFSDEERPFGIQIYGGSESSMVDAAHIVEELQPDLIDINCGCWVRNVVGQGAGAGLLRDLKKMQSIVSSVVNTVKLPVTVKTRLGWDEKSINIVESAKMIEDAGAKALTIHCRTRSQGQKGTPDYTWIPEIKSIVKIPIIINGGIISASIAKHVFESTNCDGIMIASGAIQNPWVFREIKDLLNKGVVAQPHSICERIDLLLKHLKYSIQDKGEKRGVIEFRKYYSGYLRDYPDVASLRAELMAFRTEQQIVDRIFLFMEKAATSFQVST